ncbi:MAG TPA: hypothetical protein VFG15_07020 [Amycolatopsis sp.]|nr:hypothetical protein [Amycolatopsis sp.]
MPDTTCGTAIVHACPPHRVRFVLEALNGYGLYYDGPADGETDSDTHARKALHLGETYTDDQFCCGDASRLADWLTTSAPEAAFTIYEEPAREWVGTYLTYVPGLGSFTADCDNQGELLFTQTQVLKLLNEPEDVRQRALGLTWQAAIDAMPGQVVHEPESFATHWNRPRGEVTVVGGDQGAGDLTFAALGDSDQIDAALTKHGFQRAGAWGQLDDTAHIWRTDVYRNPED